jgi:hypothetical protein
MRRLRTVWRSIRWGLTGRHPEPFQHDPVNGHDVLETLVSLPISKWSYLWDGPADRHLGPMSQDFMGAFHLGDDERRINLLDANGVNMVAIQALYRRVVALEAEVARIVADRRHAPTAPDIGSQPS